MAKRKSSSSVSGLLAAVMSLVLLIMLLFPYCVNSIARAYGLDIAGYSNAMNPLSPIFSGIGLLGVGATLISILMQMGQNARERRRDQAAKLEARSASKILMLERRMSNCKEAVAVAERRRDTLASKADALVEVGVATVEIKRLRRQVRWTNALCSALRDEIAWCQRCIQKEHDLSALGKSAKFSLAEWLPPEDMIEDDSAREANGRFVRELSLPSRMCSRPSTGRK